MDSNRISLDKNRGNGHYISQNIHESMDQVDGNSNQSQSRLVSRRNVFSAHLNGELQQQRSFITLTDLNFNKYPNFKIQHNPFDRYGCILPRKSQRETRSAPGLIKITRGESRNDQLSSIDDNTNISNPGQQRFASNPSNVIRNINNSINSNYVRNISSGISDKVNRSGTQTHRQESIQCHNVGPVEAAKRYLKDALETRRVTIRSEMTENPEFYTTSGVVTGRQFLYKLFQSKYMNRTFDLMETASATLKRHKSIEKGDESIPPQVRIQEISKLLKSARECTSIETFERCFGKLQKVINSMLYDEFIPTMDNLDKEYNKPVTIQPEDVPTVRDTCMDDNVIECDQLVYDACTESAKRNLDTLGTNIGEVYDVNDEFMSTDPVDYATLVTRFGKVFYSPKFQTDKYIYRYVILPKQSQDAAEALCKQRQALRPSEENGTNSPVFCEKSKFVRFLDENEILRQLGIHMSSGWQHFFVFKNSIKEIILRRHI